MSVVEIIVEMLVGFLLMGISYQIGWQDNYTFIQKRQRQRVPEENMPLFARKTGMGGMLMGLGLVCTPLINQAMHSRIGYLACVAGVVIGLALMMSAAKRCSGSASAEE